MDHRGLRSDVRFLSCTVVAAMALFAQGTRLSAVVPAPPSETHGVKGVVRPLEDQPLVVRVPISLTPYHGVTTRLPSGEMKSKYVPGVKKSETLRAKMEEPGHFYFEGWHVETVPGEWSSASRRFSMRVRLSRQFGAAPGMEELVGKMDVEGTLQPMQGRSVFLLQGFVRQQFRDRLGQPVVDVEVGLPAREQQLAPAVAKKAP